MKPLYNQLITLLLLSSLTLTVHSVNWYYYTLNVTIQPELYQLGYLEKDSSVIINLTTTATGTGAVDMTSLDVVMLDASKLEANQMVCGANGGTNMSASFKCVTVKSELYFLKIRKASYPIQISLDISFGFTYTANYLQYFQITVTCYYNLTNIPFNQNTTKVRTLLKATDVVKDRLARLLYFNQPMTIRLASYPIQNINYLLYHQVTTGTQPNGSIYSFSGSPLIDPVDANGIEQSGQYFMTYYITKPGYHLLSSSFAYSPDNYPLAYFIIGFPSDPYPCPYNSQFPDIKKNFQPCVGTINNNGNISPNTNVPGYPCTFYDSYSNKCLVCANGYTLSDMGNCLYNTTCPPRQYYQFGNCLTASPQCDGFDLYTGQCLNCSNPLNYVVNGACIANPALIVNCTDRQYKQNNLCIDVSPRCKQFNKVTGACTACIDGYQLSILDGSCKWKVVVCIGNQYLKDGVCYNFPPNCINFDVITLQCTSCEFSYYVSNGVCQKIICPNGKVPSRFRFGCVDVSPTCNQEGFYDKLSGECLRCRAGEKVMDGRCVQVVHPLAGCAGQTFFGDCPSVNINCKIYNLLDGECERCFQNWYKDYNGVCNLRSDNSRCREDQISIQGFCIQRPADCRVVDSFGLCMQCQREYQLTYGQCVYKLICRSGQYLNGNGVCVNVAASCAAGRFNPSTGVCLSCNDGSAAVGGVCCAAGQVVWGGECISLQGYSSMLVSVGQLDVPVCVSYHPTLGICMECNGDYRVDRMTNGCI